MKLRLACAVLRMQVSFLVGYELAEEHSRPSWKPGDFFGDLYAHSR